MARAKVNNVKRIPGFKINLERQNQIDEMRKKLMGAAKEANELRYLKDFL
jgi:hypothetical protein